MHRKPRTGAIAAGCLALAGLLAGAHGRAMAQENQNVAYCFQLEQQLVREQQLAQQTQTDLPRIAAEMRKVDRIFQTSQAKLEQSDCWSYFLFSKTLRNTKRCVQLYRQSETAERQLAALEQQRRTAEAGANNGGGQSQAIVTELARAGCGAQYQQQARRQQGTGFSFWDDAESADPGLELFGGLAQPTVPTYRTVCVRECDGYYFPISFATLPSQFEKDAAQCTQQCAAPAELYVYQNPGGEVTQATTLQGSAYSALPNAFRYRKELIKGCSCKPADYAQLGTAPVDTVDQTSTLKPAVPQDGTAAEPAQSEAWTSGQDVTVDPNTSIGDLIDKSELPPAGETAEPQ